MKIDRSNFEIWLIDWLDGNLNENQTDQLEAFLLENPDLKAEAEEIAGIRLEPAEDKFQFKDSLLKSASDLSENQFEHLCVAFLENDLTLPQMEEIKQEIAADPRRKAIFDAIRKARLVPPEIIFSGKKKLLHLTTTQKVIRISIAALSAAAITAVVLFISLPARRNVEITAALATPDTGVTRELIIVSKAPLTNLSSPIKRQKRELQAVRLAPPPEQATAYVAKNELVSPEDIPDISNVAIGHGPDLSPSIPGNLVAINFEVKPVDDGRSKIGKLIARTFREKILRDKSVNDNPLKIYEIAQAGVSGLNKLLGWEMALNERKDDNGDLKSVYFSSKILKFNAPVKKLSDTK